MRGGPVMLRPVRAIRCSSLQFCPSLSAAVFSTLLIDFRTISPLQLELPNVTQKCPTMSLGNPFISESKGQMSRSRGTKIVPALIFALFCVLLLLVIVIDMV